MLQNKYRFILFILLAGSVSAAAQQADVWDLKRCINYAWEHNIQVQLSDLGNQQAQSDYLQAMANHLPSVNGNAQHQLNFGRSINPFTNTFVNQQVGTSIFSMSFGWSVFNGFQIQNNRKAQQNNVLATREDMQAAKNNAALAVANAYLQCLFTADQVNIAASQLDATRANLKRIEKMVDAGAMSLDNQYNLNAQMATEEFNLVTAQNNERIALLQLELLLQLKHNDNFSVSRFDNASLPADIGASLEDIYTKALSQSPQVKRDELLYQSAMYGLKAAKGGRLPNIFVSSNLSSLYSDSRVDVVGVNVKGVQPIGYVGGTLDTVFAPQLDYITRKTPFNDQINNNFGRTLGASLRIPLFNNLQNHNAIVRAKLGVQRASLTLNQTRNQLYNDVSTAYVNRKAAFTRFDAAKKNVSAQEENFKFAQARYDQGMMNAVDYLQAKNRFQQAQSSLLQARYEFIFRSKILEFYQNATLNP